MARTALVIEGGSMRAAYANGVLAAFEEAGLGFDAVYGTSAGGALAGWFAAGQARDALATWRYAQDRRILSWRRWLSGRGALLDHDALYAIVYERERPLDAKAVAAAPFPVVVTVTDVETGGVEYVDVRRGPVLAWLRATGRLPVGAGPPVEIEGRRFLDGGLVDPVPLARAVADGATDVTVVFNRPAGPRAPESRASTRLVARRYPAVAPAILRRHEMYNAAQALAAAPPKGVRVRVVRPAADTGVRRLTRDLRLLERAMAQGRRDGQSALVLA